MSVTAVFRHGIPHTSTRCAIRFAELCACYQLVSRLRGAAYHWAIASTQVVHNLVNIRLTA